MSLTIGILGAGRMGRGIALHFAFTGHHAVLIDLKPRDEASFTSYKSEALQEIEADLHFMVGLELMREDQVDTALGHVEIIQGDGAAGHLKSCDVIFEGVPEVIEAKREAFEFVCQHVGDEALIASTSSTFAVGELAAFVTHPERFMNAHWLNPAHLLPLVEVARGAQSSDEAVEQMRALLSSVDKVAVLCNDQPGYIIPRMQCLIMNEAARMVEEGVASAEEIDKAILAGFGPRYASLGVLEFVDWGGLDIVYYASNYLKDKLHPRYAPAEIIETKMAEEERGLRDGKGFFDYQSRDLKAYREQRLGAFVELLSVRGLLPKCGVK
jgi:3-hydroxybutyryl-CoA dehydrogenase